MKKKLLAGIASVCLMATLSVGATMAYYTAQTGEVKNTFTIGNVAINVVEPNWKPDQGKDLIPGAEVAKDPMITNTGASSGYMMIQISGMDDMAKLGFSAKNKTAAGYNTADWTLVDEKGNAIVSDGTLVDGYYVYKAAVASKASTSPLFTSIVLASSATESTESQYQVIGQIVYDTNGNVVIDAKTGTPAVEYVIKGINNKKFESYAEAEAYVLDPKNGLNTGASFVFDLKVKGYSIQSDGIQYQDKGVYTWVGELTGKGTATATGAE